MSPLITPDQAMRAISGGVAPLGSESVPTILCNERVLAAPVTADRPFPPFDRAMMDGIATHSRWLSGAKPITLPLQGLHAAGSPPPAALEHGHAYEIMTGAVLPADCDTLIPYEEIAITTSDDPTGKVATVTGLVPPPNQFIHRTGSDCSKGEVLLREGQQLTPPALGLAASAGYAALSVTLRPAVAIVSTGDELVDIAATPEPWQIRRSSPVALTALLSPTTNEPPAVFCVPDDEEETAQILSNICSRFDAIVITGGISKGKRDFIRPVLERIIGQPLFHGVAQRPGKPLAVWKTADSPIVFALPGNPTSTLACATRYVVPALRALAGQLTEPPQVHLTTMPPRNTKLTQFLPARLDPATGFATITSPKNSGDELSPAQATGFVEIPSGPSEPPFTFYRL